MIVVVPTHLLASEGDPREKDVSRTGKQDGRGAWFPRVLVSLGPLGSGFSEAPASPLQLNRGRGGLLGHVMWHAVSLSFILKEGLKAECMAVNRPAWGAGLLGCTASWRNSFFLLFSRVTQSLTS